MPSRMIHYLVAEEVAKQVEIENMNRFKLGSICPDMSKHRTHFMEIHGDVKGCNWITFLSKYENKMKRDDLYLGIMCHIITDAGFIIPP